MKYSIFILLLLVCLTLGAEQTNAQSIGVESVVNVEIVPSIPKAGETVYVSLTSYITDINTSNISWIINGKTIKSGRGEKNFNFVMGGDGQTTNLRILVTTSEGERVEKSYPLRPSSVDLIWQTDGFTPPFYRGKALFSHQNRATVIAVPHITSTNGIELNPRSMVYTWKKNGSVIESASGLGKNTYTFEGSMISRQVIISVEVSADNNGTGVANLIINPIDPTIVFYKMDPSYGIELQQAIGVSANIGKQNEVSIISMPYFFSSNDYLSNTLINKWSINGTQIENDINTPVQTFRRKDGSAGSSNISLSVESPNRILQYSRKNFDLIFESNN